MAARNQDFVIGFIGQRRLPVPAQENGVDPDFLYLTPGVSMAEPGDSLGQQYRSPEQVILDSGCDVIIVGRGIYGAADPAAKAREYQKAGWDAYLKRVGKA